MDRKIGLLLLITVVFSFSSIISLPANGMDLSFEQAASIARSKNASLRAAQLEENQIRQIRLATRGLYFPRIDLSAQYVRLGDDITLDLNPIRDAMVEIETFKNPAVGQQVDALLPSFEQTIQKETFWLTNANLSWPIFTGGKIVAANRAAASLLDKSSEKLRNVESDLISELTYRYFGLRFSLKVVDVRRKVLQGMDEHLYNAIKLEESGMIAKAERLHAQVARSEAERELSKALRDVELARTALNNTLNTSDFIEPVSPLFLFRNLEPVSYFHQRALENSPILKQLAASREVAHQQYRKELAGWLPDVYVLGTRQIDDHDFTDYVPEWSAGVVATFTLFDGMARSHRISAARYTRERVAALEDKMQLDIGTLVEKSYNELLRSIEQYEALQDSYDYADEYVRVRRKAFQEGLATSLDVIDAELYLSRVEIDRLNAVFEFDANLAKLLAICGDTDRLQIYRTKGEQEVQF